jgi:6-phosphogluconolactonase
MIESFDDRRDISISDDKQKAIAFSVDHFLEIGKKAIATRGAFTVALSGGSTPKAIFEALSHEKNALDWEKVLLFWSDERCVPPDHPDSNYKMAMDSGLSTLGIPKENIFRMRGEDQPEIASKAYDLLINEEVPDKTFDLVMLGMGPDGHTASLFPKTHALHTKGHLCTANFLPQKDTWRLTLTYDCINQARNIALYVLGEGKAEMVNTVLNGPSDPDTYPVQRIGTPKTSALWILDRAAAANL